MQTPPPPITEQRRRGIGLTGLLYLLVVHLLAGLFVYEKVSGKSIFNLPRGGDDEAAVSVDSLATHDSLATPPDHQAAPTPDYTAIPAPPGALLIPVAGVKRKDLQDTYTQSRSGGRVHNAIDIMAAEGTPVVAVADGTIARLFDSQMGGITIYQWSADKKYVYYYAHLQRRADGLQEGMAIRRGQVLGWVGDTGNAGKGNFHLHFTITIPKDSTRHWEGEDVNPYPLLVNGIEVPRQ